MNRKQKRPTKVEREGGEGLMKRCLCVVELKKAYKRIAELEKDVEELHVLVSDGIKREHRYCSILRKLGYEPLTGTLTRFTFLKNFLSPRL